MKGVEFFFSLFLLALVTVASVNAFLVPPARVHSTLTASHSGGDIKSVGSSSATSSSFGIKLFSARDDQAINTLDGVSMKGELLKKLKGDREMDEKEIEEVINQLQALPETLNVRDYTTMIGSLRRVKKFKKALELLADMQRRGITPNEITYSSVMGILASAGRWREALDMLVIIKEASPSGPDASSYTSAMIACLKGNQWSTALDLFEEVCETRIQITEGMYTAVISAYEKAGQWRKTLELLREMKMQGITPSVFTYNSAIFSTKKDKQWMEAGMLLGEMRKDGLTPDRNSYHAAMATCEAAGQYQAVMDIFEEMHQLGCPASRQSYLYVTRACKEYMEFNGLKDESLLAYLRRNAISTAMLEEYETAQDTNKVILLRKPQLLELVSKDKLPVDRPTWMDFM
jgi:pentatricopeptide repeat protein